MGSAAPRMTRKFIERARHHGMQNCELCVRSSFNMCLGLVWSLHSHKRAMYLYARADHL